MSKFITGVGRCSYLNINQPRAMEDGQKPKYSVSFIIPKSDTKTINGIKAAIKTAYEEGAGTLRGSGKSVPALDSIKNPLRDGDTERPDDPAYANSYFINASSLTQPGVVDVNCQTIIDPSELYSGIYGRISVNFYAYNKNGNRGVACGLNNLQKVKDGEPLGGVSRAEDDFNDGFKPEPEEDFLD